MKIFKIGLVLFDTEDVSHYSGFRFGLKKQSWNETIKT